MKNIGFLLIVSLLLSACGGIGVDPDETIQNELITSPSDDPTDGEGVIVVDTESDSWLAGREAYAEQCVLCHDDASTSALDGNGLTSIDPQDYDGKKANLIAVIERMPTAATANCKGSCAEDLYYYIAGGFDPVDATRDDADSDGVEDSADNCPQVAGSLSNNGCPLSSDADTDGDGVYGDMDLCPTIKGASDRADGCPWPTNPVVVDAFALGQASYEAQCSVCHDGDSGKGTHPFNSVAPIVGDDGRFDCSLTDCSDLNALSAYIATYMPVGAVSNCVGDCANQIAYYIIEDFTDDDGDGVFGRDDLCPEQSGNGDNGCDSNTVSLPGKLQAEVYSDYSDSTPGNETGAMDSGDDVDLGDSGDTDGSPNIGWIAAGEWLEYSVVLSQTGSYKVSTRVASATTAGSFSLFLDDTKIVDALTVPDTGGWQTWQTLETNIPDLAAGNYVLRFVADGDGFNVNWFEFELIAADVADTDVDGDGVNDDVDACPQLSGDDSAQGCPDRDGDGVQDVSDSCPLLAAGELDGCPNGGAEYDLAEGEALYNGTCATCHDSATANIQGTAIFLGYQESEIVGDDGLFACIRTDCANTNSLALYIDQYMPFGGEKCEGDCARQVANFIVQTMGKGIEPDTDGDGIIDRDDLCPTVAGSAEFDGCSNDPLSGAALWVEKGCAGCHGSEGQGISVGDVLRQQIVFENWNLSSLTTKIHDTMPAAPADPASCEDACAEKIAEYILQELAPELSCDGEEELLPRRLRLLTPTEYQNSVVDLFALSADTNFVANFPVTARVRGFDNNAAQTAVSSSHIDQYWSAAKSISDGLSVDALINCGGLTQDMCADTFVSEFGLKIFRRPLTADEEIDYVDLFNSASDSDEGVRFVVRAMLMSPNFLYRFEIGEASGAEYQLTPFETATLLSYTFLGSTPDQALLDAAAANALTTKAQLQAQVARLLTDGRAKDQLIHFAKQWLQIVDLKNVDKDNVIYPQYTDDLAEAMDKEIELFIADVFFDQDTDFTTLLTADFTYVNELLAQFYGLNGVSGSDFSRVDAGDERGGILNLSGFLASFGKRDQSSPIKRGVYVREHLLCQEFPTPPANVGEVEPLDPTKSTRERFTAHTNNEGCASCHTKIDPIGFSFERYDGIGQYRETEGNNIAVDDSGTLEGLFNMNDTDSTDYNGTKGLADILASTENSATCFADHFHTYMEGVAEPNACAVADMSQRWKEKNFSLYEMWLESVAGDTFLKRQ